MINFDTTNGTRAMSRCGLCGAQFIGAHACVQPSISTNLQSFTWNGPICHACNTPYLGHHDCDVELMPCPDNKPGCRVTHWCHKP